MARGAPSLQLQANGDAPMIAEKQQRMVQCCAPLRIDKVLLQNGITESKDPAFKYPRMHSISAILGYKATAAWDHHVLPRSMATAMGDSGAGEGNASPPRAGMPDSAGRCCSARERPSAAAPAHPSGGVLAPAAPRPGLARPPRNLPAAARPKEREARRVAGRCSARRRSPAAAPPALCSPADTLG